MIRAAGNCGCSFQDPGISLATSSTCGGGFVLFLSILNEFILGRCAISDPCNRVVDTPDDILYGQYDFIVVGGGTAGSVVAGRLSEDGNYKVLLLEAGDVDPVSSRVPGYYGVFNHNPLLDWKYRTQPGDFCHDYDSKCRWPRGKTLGGSSVLNGMMYHRGHRADFDVDWKAAGVKTWSFEDNLKYFQKLEDNKEIGSVVSSKYHTAGGRMPIRRFRHTPEMAYDILQAANMSGYKIIEDMNNPETPEGFTIAQTFTDDGQRVTPARAYLQPYWNRPNLHVKVNSQVTKVLLKNKVAYGVEYVNKGNKRAAIAAKEVILSGGALNSPQILLLSGIGPAETLAKHNIPIVADLPVGQNLQNHIGINLYFVLNKEADSHNLDWIVSTEYLLERTGPLTSTDVTQVTGLLTSPLADKSKNQPDIQYFFNPPAAYNCSNTDTVSGKVKGLHISANVVALLPKSVGYLTLNSSDPLDYPLFYPNYFDHPDDMRVIKYGTKYLQKLFESEVFTEKYGVTWDNEYSACLHLKTWSDEWTECIARNYTDGQNHQVGSTAIAQVVDEQLRVYDVRRLRVIDAGVIPVVPTGNPQAVIMMVAERGAQEILKHWSWVSESLKKSRSRKSKKSKIVQKIKKYVRKLSQ